ncbi:MAG TPA: hypothetical protein VK460_07915, partial [Burkholderiales bacterium]|nr:hypothetical protein [Burkholderiales bacterium]
AGFRFLGNVTLLCQPLGIIVQHAVFITASHASPAHLNAAWKRYILVKSGVWFDLDQGIWKPKSNNKYDIQVSLCDGRLIPSSQY